MPVSPESEWEFCQMSSSLQAFRATTLRRPGVSAAYDELGESGAGRHSPFIATLRRYASALGYRLEPKLVKRSPAATGSSRGR